MSVEFFDMAVNLTPPVGHLEHVPLTLGPNWQQNDLRLLFATASARQDQGATASMIRMRDDPPTSFTAAYSLNPGNETEGVYYRRLLTGDSDSSVAWAKPSGWQHFVWATLTCRGADPTLSPTGGRLSVSHVCEETTATIASVSVPAAGIMLFCLGTVADPARNASWPQWSTSMGVPTGWRHLVATDKAGANFVADDTNSHIVVFGKSFASSGSTGSVSLPCGAGMPAFAGLWCFVRVAQDVVIPVVAA